MKGPFENEDDDGRPVTRPAATATGTDPEFLFRALCDIHMLARRGLSHADHEMTMNRLRQIVAFCEKAGVPAASVLRAELVPEPLCLGCVEGWLAFQFNSGSGRIWHEDSGGRRFLCSSSNRPRLGDVPTVERMTNDGSIGTGPTKE